MKKEYLEKVKVALLLSRHLIFSGGTGTGKTTQVLAVAKELVGEENIFSYRGHARSESIDFLGMYIRHGEGMVFNDGFLTMAFVKAATEKVVVFIDEIGRIPDPEKDLLVGCLTPDDEGFYNLDTGKGIEGNGRFSTETLRVPKENLIVLGTTNQGEGFDVALGDEAFSERFIVSEVEDDVYDIILSIGNEKLKGRDILLEEILKEFKAAVESGDLKHHMNFRLSEMWFSLITDDVLDENIKAEMLIGYVYDKYVSNQTVPVKNILTGMVNAVRTASPALPEAIDNSEMEAIAERMAKAMGSK